MNENGRKLYRSRENRMIAGICGGLGEYFGIDPTLVRVLYALGAVVTGSVLFWAYIIMLIVIPEEPLASQAIVDAPVEEEPVDQETSDEE